MDEQLDFGFQGGPSPVRTLDFTTLFQEYDPIAVADGALVVTKKFAGGPPIGQEIGAAAVSGTTTYSRLVREDYNPELRGNNGLRIFEQMRKSDGQVRATLNLVKTPIVAARWYIEPASDAKKDKKIADFVWNNLTKWMSVSWPQLLRECLLMLDFGYYMFEKVYDYAPDGSGRVIWSKFGPRHPLDVQRWEFDTHGGPVRVWIYGPDLSKPVDIPIEKLAVFTFEKESGQIQGVSVLRSAYKHWFYKENMYKIDAIQKERHGIGIPIITLPPNFTQADRVLADEMGRNLRTNEKAHIILPPNWVIEMLDLKGNPVDSLASIDHHDLQIARNVLGHFINQERGQQTDRQDFFMKATRFIADIVRDVFNKYCIPQIVDWNWNVTDYPELRVRRLGETVDWRTISFAMRNLIGAGVIIPDDDLEDWARDEMDLPRRDLTSGRALATPQLPDVGPPGQSTAAGSTQGKSAGKANTGTDQSGKSSSGGGKGPSNGSIEG